MVTPVIGGGRPKCYSEDTMVEPPTCHNAAVTFLIWKSGNTVENAVISSHRHQPHDNDMEKELCKYWRKTIR
jgi:hypothetical protein